ncbi:MAG TPA: hypothetical protein VLI46_08250 [Ramlibacter sp.]|nr:hypothetical protein [Ramlibacter sp.]
MATKKTAIVAPTTDGGKLTTPKRVNSFAPKKFEEHTLVDSENKVVGHVRVKPNGILWSPKNGKDWYGVTLADFATFLESKGKKQSK